MSTKHIRSAADLVRFDAGLKIECLDCGNCVTLSGFEVAKRGGSGDLRKLKQRLRCSRCRGRSSRLTVLPPPGPR